MLNLEERNYYFIVTIYLENKAWLKEYVTHFRSLLRQH